MIQLVIMTGAVNNVMQSESDSHKKAPNGANLQEHHLLNFWSITLGVAPNNIYYIDLSTESKMISYNIDHLDPDIIIHGSEHEDPEYEVYHECLLWCDEQDIKYKVRCDVTEVEWDTEVWDTVEEMVKVFMCFEDGAEAARFVLRWSH